MDNLFTLEIDHEKYLSSPIMRYIGGSVNYYDNYTLNLISNIELENLIKDLGYQKIE